MRAAVLREFGAPLSVEEVTLAPPGPEEARVRIDACAVCHSDLRALAGGWGGRLPAVYGHEAAGRVLEAGVAAGGLVAGDTVAVHLVRHCGACGDCARGGPTQCQAEFELDRPGPLSDGAGGRIVQGFRTGAFAEEVVVHRSQVVRVPPSLAPECAALLSCGVLTGYGAAVNAGRVRPGESVAAFGAGGVGMNCIQGAAVAGAERIVAVDVSDRKLAVARSFGATHTVNARREDAVRRIRELTGGGADCVLATIVTDPAFAAAYASLRRGGRLVMVGMADDGARIALDPTDVADRGVRILGTKMGGRSPVADIPELVAMHAAGRLRLEELISGTWPLDRINDALDDSRSGESIRNVVLF